MGNINKKDKYFSVALAGFIFGIFIRSLVEVSFSYIFLFILISFSAFAFEYVNASSNIARNRPTPLLIFSCLFAFGVFWFNYSDYSITDGALYSSVNRVVTIEGIIADEPDNRENGTRIIFSPSSLESGDIRNNGLIVLTVPRYPEFQYGDQVKIKGKLSFPKNFTTDSNKEFDYVSYLAKDDIRYEIYMPEIEYISRGHGNLIKTYLFNLKSAFMRSVESVLPSPESALLGGLVIGAKTSLGKDLQDDFRKAGLVHIVVLSGYNVSIVAAAFMKSLSFLPRMVGISFGAISIVLFALMTGASATTVRASIMALLVILTKVTGRTYNITRALLIAGFFMVLQNPKILVFDLSFQLSFLATLALIYVSPLVEPKLQFITERFGLRGIVSATIATQIFVSPFILYSMGNFSVVALITNLLVLPFIPTTMFFGFTAGALAFLWKIIALPFAFIAKIFLSYELGVVKVFSHFPFAAINISYFPIGLMIAIYVFYGWYILKNKKTSLS